MLSNSRVSLRAFGIAAILIAAAGFHALMAQSSTATVSGTVTDASGSVVAGASVEVKSVETGITQTTTSNQQGRYRVTQLSVGDYEVQTSHPGFQTMVRKGITLTVGNEAVVDVALQVGQSQQTVTVDAQASTVDVSSSAVASLVEGTQMRELPLNGRNFEQLLTLAPGVQALNPSGKILFGVQPNYSVSGSRPQGQAFLIDNTNMLNYFGHGTGAGSTGSSLGIEAISEFQTLTNTYSAQFGGNGAAINAVTKGGSNALHGSAYEFLRNSALDARNFFDNYRRPGETYARVPTFRRNQFGASAGGPIKKDKTFFFVNWESFRQGLGQTSVANVPDSNARNGYLPCASATAYACNNATGLAYVGVNPAMASTLALYPVATATVGGGIGTLNSVTTSVANETYFVARIDHTISAKDSIFARYIRDAADINLPVATSPIPLYPEIVHTLNNYVTVEWKHLVSSNIVNLARTSFLRPTEQSLQDASLAPLSFFPGRPDGRVGVTGLSQLGPIQDDPYRLIVNHFVFGDDVLWTHGAHNIRFGITVDRTQNNTNLSAGNGGAWTFSSLLGFLTNAATQFQGPLPGKDDTTRDMRELFVLPYVQDEWKVLPRLTLNIGVRYDWGANPYERLNKLHSIVNAPYVGIVSVPNVYANNITKKNFAPRIGFAYDVFGDHKTSLRGGFGMFYDTITAKDYTPGFVRTAPYGLSNQANPVYPTAFSTSAAAAVLQVNSLVDYQTKNTPYQMQYNLNIQRDLGDGMVLTVGYVGSRGVHLINQRDSNPPVPTTNAAGQTVLGSLVNGKITPNPRINPALAFVLQRQGWGSSNYNALQTSVNRRFAKRWQMQASYSFSKSMDYGSANDNQSGQGQGGSNNAQNPYDNKNEYSRSTFDRTHSFRLSSVYVLPAWKSSALLDAIAGSWQMSGIFSAVSGSPFTVFLGFDQAGTQQTAGQRPNLLPGHSSNPILGTPTQWYDPSSFGVPAVGTFGNLGKATLIAPKLVDLDYSLSKTARIPKISEQFAAQFRAEIFNIFNHPNFGLPDNTVLLQAPNGGATVSPTAGRITSTNTSSRQIQLALKFTF